MTAHAVVRQVVPAGAAETFDLLHDYPRRLEWDTLLRRARTVGDISPAQGVEAECSARWSLGGLTFRTRYVTFRRPDLAAVTLVNRPPLFAGWSASIRHLPLPQGHSEVVYTLTFSCRPRVLARLLEPVALAAFRWETRRRLRALAAYLGAHPGFSAYRAYRADPQKRGRDVSRRRSWAYDGGQRIGTWCRLRLDGRRQGWRARWRRSGAGPG